MEMRPLFACYIHPRSPARCESALNPLQPGSRRKSPRTNPPGQNPPGQNPPGQNPPDKIPPLYSVYNIPLPPKF